MSAANYHLIVRKGPKPGQIYPLLATNITLGRDPMSDIVLNDPEVSRYHAQLIQTDAGYQIQDMGSTNGTYVAGQQLGDEPMPLLPGYDVLLGSGITLSYEMTGGDEDASGATVVEGSAPEWTTAAPEVEDPALPEPKPAAAPLTPPVDDEAARQKKRNTTLIVVALLLLCCCCAFVVFMWFYGGDWLLEQLGFQLTLSTTTFLPLTA